MPLKMNILAPGTSVGFMSKRGTHSPGHSQRSLTAQRSRNPGWQPFSEAVGLTLKKEWSPEIWFLFPLVGSNNFRGYLWNISWDHHGCKPISSCRWLILYYSAEWIWRKGRNLPDIVYTKILEFNCSRNIVWLILRRLHFMEFIAVLNSNYWKTETFKSIVLMILPFWRKRKSNMCFFLQRVPSISQSSLIKHKISFMEMSLSKSSTVSIFLSTFGSKYALI